jgi:hypothetical protein
MKKVIAMSDVTAGTLAALSVINDVVERKLQGKKQTPAGIVKKLEKSVRLSEQLDTALAVFNAVIPLMIEKSRGLS